MKLLLLLALLLTGGVLLIKYAGSQPPLRGLTLESGTEVLISRARPAVLFSPARHMRLLTAGWCSISPETNTSLSGDARLFLAAYADRQGTLITMLGEADGEWEWEAAHHMSFPPLRSAKEAYGSETLYEHIYLLPAAQNPFHELARTADETEPREHAPSLVYRAKVLMNFRKMLVVFEYHEVLNSGPEKGIAYNIPLLNAFEQRGRAACLILTDEHPLHGRHLSRMNTLSRDFSRGRLSRWAGDMQRRGEF